MMTLLAAIDRNNAIGKNNALLYRVPEDMKNFRQMTLGSLVICGRKTLESFPNGKPLPKRDTIVLSGQLQEDPATPSLRVARSVEEAIAIAKTRPDPSQQVFVIGGERVYRAFCSLCDRAVLTEIDAETPDADAFFPVLSEQDGWFVTERSEWMVSESGLSYRFVTYQK